MPIFEYECPVCGAEREEIQKRGDPAPCCPDCTVADSPDHVTMNKKLPTKTGVQFNGNGWYETDYKGKK